MSRNSATIEVPGKIEKNDMVGSFQVAGLFDLCQFLMLGSRTGTFTIYREGGTVKLYFVEGQIVNAAEEPAGTQGRDVALAALRTIEGGFRFRAEDTTPPRLIEDATQNLLLDAARSIDEMEAEKAPVGKSGSGVSLENELLEKQAKAGTLQSIFSKIEEEVAHDCETEPFAQLLEKTAERGGDLLFLREGHSPVIVRSGRVVERLPGTVRDDIFREVRLRLDGTGIVEQAEERYRLVEGFSEGVIAFRRIGQSLSLESLNLPADTVENLVSGRRGILLLTADPPEAGASLYTGAMTHLVAAGHTAIVLGDHALSPEEAGLVISHPRPINRESYRHLHSQVGSFQPSFVLLPELRSGDDAALILDIARTGRRVLTTLPGCSGADALRRAAHWFREETTLRSIAALLSGILAVRMVPGESGRAVSVSSGAPWTAEAAELLEREDFSALESLLETDAGEASFRHSLARLVQSSSIGKEEAEKLSSLLPGPAART